VKWPIILPAKESLLFAKLIGRANSQQSPLVDIQPAVPMVFLIKFANKRISVALIAGRLFTVPVTDSRCNEGLSFLQSYSWLEQ
jgi:hypothetical protein